MIYMCSYCSGEIRPSDDVESNGDKDAVTHGMCNRCYRIMRGNMDASVTDVRDKSLGSVPACQRLGGL